MNDARSVNVRADLWPTFPGRGTGSLLEIDPWLPSEISAISPLVERLMRLVEGSHCVTDEETEVELALREAQMGTVFLAPSKQKMDYLEKKLHINSLTSTSKMYTRF